MRHWDVFHSTRLEAERSLTSETVRQAIARGDLVADDLIRRSGETGWTRVGDSPDFATLLAGVTEAEPEIDLEDEAEAEAPPAPTPEEFAPPSDVQEFDVLAVDENRDVSMFEAVAEFEDREASDFELNPDAFATIDRDELRRAEFPPEDDEEDEFDFIPGSEPEVAPQAHPEPTPEPADQHRQPSSAVAMPVLPDEETQRPDLVEYYNDPIADLDLEEPEPDPQDEDDEAVEFTLSRNKAETVEELDLAAMVDVAFQLVLFFLVTAQVVLFKTLEVPKPNEDKPPDAAVQARAKSIDELEKDYILVEVDAAGNIKVDRQPVAAQRSVLVEKLRKTREDTQRKAMLLSADFATRHENAVLVFDVANEIDLKIAIAQPAAKK